MVEEIRKVSVAWSWNFWGQELEIVNPSNEANQELLVSNLRCQDEFEVRGQKTEAAWLRHLKSDERVCKGTSDSEGPWGCKWHAPPHSDFLKVETWTSWVSYLKHGNQWLTGIISKSYLYYFEKTCSSEFWNKLTPNLGEKRVPLLDLIQNPTIHFKASRRHFHIWKRLPHFLFQMAFI